jgi:hypothetical protein
LGISIRQVLSSCNHRPLFRHGSISFSRMHAVFSQLSFPQGCFREHDITGWLNATARDAPEVMQVTHVSLPAAGVVASLSSSSSC